MESTEVAVATRRLLRSLRAVIGLSTGARPQPFSLLRQARASPSGGAEERVSSAASAAAGMRYTPAPRRTLQAVGAGGVETRSLVLRHLRR